MCADKSASNYGVDYEENKKKRLGEGEFELFSCTVGDQCQQKMLVWSHTHENKKKKKYIHQSKNVNRCYSPRV
jgi:hypothetical protein